MIDVADAVLGIPVGLSRDDAHRYYLRPTYDSEAIGPIPSVTTVLGVLAKDGLTYAMARDTARYAIDNLELLARMVADFGPAPATQAVAAKVRTDWDRKGDLGSRVHAWAERLFRGELSTGPAPVTEADVVPFIDSLASFAYDLNPTILAVEELVCFTDTLRNRPLYAGTLDLVAGLEGRTWLLDIKTGGSKLGDVYPEHALQLAAYGYATFVGRPGDPTRYALPQIDAYGVLHVRPEGYALYPYEVTQNTWLAFMAALELWQWRNGPGKTIKKGRFTK